MTESNEGGFDRRGLMLAAAMGGLAAVAPGAARAQTNGESTYERVMRTKTVRVGIRTGNLPGFTKDIATGKWIGANIAMMENMADGLGGFKIEYIEEAAALNNIISLQTFKCDLSFGLNPSPARALSIDFSTSLFDHPFGILARPSFSATSWAELNRPEVKVAVTIGTTEETAVRSFAPKATISAFKTREEMLLALGAGRVDCGIFAAMLALVAAKRNPAAGRFMLIDKPRIQLPNCIGVPKERDARWRELINIFITYYRGIGQIQLWYEAALEEQGLSRADIPPGIF